MIFLLFTVTSSVLTATPTPTLRVEIVKGENRLFIIDREDRVQNISFENRIEIIAGD